MSQAEQVPRRRRRGPRAAGTPLAPPAAVVGSGSLAAPSKDPASAVVTAGLPAVEQPAGKVAASGKARSGESRRKAGRSGELGQAHSERGWRDLAGSTPSQVGVSGAMRARDVARPGPAELAAAERDLVIVRRLWQPPAGEPGGP